MNKNNFLPKISVIIPCWKVEDWVSHCLNSVLNQTYRNFEIVVVEDCSPDNTLKKIIELKDKNDNYNQIVIIQNEKNIGSSKARQKGIDNAIGDYLYFLDADDWIESETLELFVKVLQEDREVEVVSGRFQDIYEQKIIPYPKESSYLNRLSTKEISYQMMARQIRWNLWNRLIKRDFFKRIQMPANNNGEDYVLMCKVFYQAEKVKFIDCITYNYNHLNENTFQKNSKALKHIKDVYKAFKILRCDFWFDSKAEKSIDIGENIYIAQQLAQVENGDDFDCLLNKHMKLNLIWQREIKLKYKLLLLLYKFNQKKMIQYINLHRK